MNALLEQLCSMIEAAMMANKMLEAGDMDGLATWNRILRAIEELRAGKRPEGRRVGRFTVIDGGLS